MTSTPFDPSVARRMGNPMTRATLIAPKAATTALLAALADASGVAPTLITSRKRQRHLALARQIGMYVFLTAFQGLEWATLMQGGALFQRDHSTLIHARACIDARQQIDPTVLAIVATVMARLERELSSEHYGVQVQRNVAAWRTNVLASNAAAWHVMVQQ